MSEFGMTSKGYITEFVIDKLADKVEFFLNSKLEPMIHIPEEEFQQDWPVDSQRILDLLIAVFYDVSLGEILKAPEREFLLSQIRQKCRQGERRFTQIEAEEAEKNLIVRATLSFLDDHESFSGRTADLLHNLKNSPLAESISQRQEFPEFTSIFSRRLKLLIPVLSGYGVKVIIEHRESGSHCCLSRLASFEMKPKATLKRIDNPDDSDDSQRSRQAVVSESSAVTD